MMSQKISLSGSVAGYMLKTVERFVRLEREIESLRWRTHRGEMNEMKNHVLAARHETRRLLQELDMVLHCLKEQTEEEEPPNLKIISE